MEENENHGGHPSNDPSIERTQNEETVVNRPGEGDGAEGGEVASDEPSAPANPAPDPHSTE